MKKKILLSVLAVGLLVGACISGCFLFRTIWTINPTFPYIEGEITVAEAAYWEYVKVGVFTDTGPLYYHEKNTGSTYRLAYSDLDDDSSVAVTPDNLGTEIVAGDLATKKFYYLELPPTAVNVFAVAWYDDNKDGKLDFIDTDNVVLSSADDDIIAGGEFNRFSKKLVAGTLTTAALFQDDGAGGYKYGTLAYLESDDNDELTR